MITHLHPTGSVSEHAPAIPARTAIVVGGGIAGIAASVRLAQAGVAVTLLETRRKLGGRATSFVDSRTGETLDNCQHVALRCCTNYIEFCRLLGVEHKLTWLREIFWVEAGGRVSVMKPGPLPAPAHFTLSFLGASFLNAAQKGRVSRAMAAAARSERSLYRGQTFAQWLAAHAQQDDDIRRFWEPVVVSACNLPSSKVCAETALHVFQEGFLAHREAAAIGVAAVPLVDLYDPAEKAVCAAGGTLRLGASVDRIRLGEVRLFGGEVLKADTIICAVPFERALRIVDETILTEDPRFEPLCHIMHSPILGVHLGFSRPVLPLPAAVLVERPTQWVFRKDAEGRRVHAVISAADEWIALDEGRIVERVLDDLRACFPAARNAEPVSWRAVKEKQATFAPTPEAERTRPTTLGPMGVRGLILAGDYVRTGWPATMEGAARSGFMAAAAALGESMERAVELPLRPGWTVRTLCRALTQPAQAGAQDSNKRTGNTSADRSI